MKARLKHRPSPALIISVFALVIAVGGGTFAIAASDKKTDKKIANKVVTTRAPGLTVGNSNALAGAAASSYQLRSMWALVSGGTILAQSGGITVDTNSPANVWFLGFPAKVQGKGISATIHFPPTSTEQTVYAAPCGGGGPDAVTCASNNDSNHLRVETRLDTGGVSATPFYVVVTP